MGFETAKKAGLITFLSPFFQVATSSLCRSVAAAMLTPTADALLIKRSKNTVCFREEMQPFTFSNPSANSQNSLCQNVSSRKCNVGLKGLLICSSGSCCSPNTSGGRLLLHLKPLLHLLYFVLPFCLNLAKT